MKKHLLLIGIIALAIGFTSCTDYGTKLVYGDLELYYTEDVTEDEAEAVGEYLEEIGLTDGDEMSIQIAKDGDTYQFKAVAKEDYDEIEDYKNNVLIFLYSISEEVFDGEPVEFHYCDEYFETLETIDMDD